MPAPGLVLKSHFFSEVKPKVPEIVIAPGTLPITVELIPEEPPPKRPTLHLKPKVKS